MTVIVAFALTANGAKDKATPREHGHPGPLPAVAASALPVANAATQAACVKVFAKLPVELGDLAPRRTETDSTFVAAWGDPAVLLRCGVARPLELTPKSAAFVIRINDVDWIPRKTADATVFTSIDRRVYIEVVVPQQWTFGAAISEAVKVLPAVCKSQSSTGNVPTAALCTNRPS